MATIDRIRKLLALVECDGAAPNESEVARRLAEQLMAAAGLHESDVLTSTSDKAASVREQTSRRYDRHGSIIAAAVARIVGCSVYSAARPAHRERCPGCADFTDEHEHIFEAGTYLVWVGSDDQRVAAIELHGWVCRQIERLSEVARATAREQHKPRQWLTSYRIGVASAISEQARQIVQFRPVVQPVGQALVARDSVAHAIARHMAGLNLSKSRASRVRGDAYAIGRNDGSSVSLRRPMATSGQKKLGAG